MNLELNYSESLNLFDEDFKLDESIDDNNEEENSYFNNENNNDVQNLAVAANNDSNKLINIRYITTDSSSSTTTTNDTTSSSLSRFDEIIELSNNFAQSNSIASNNKNNFWRKKIECLQVKVSNNNLGCQLPYNSILYTLNEVHNDILEVFVNKNTSRMR